MLQHDGLEQGSMLRIEDFIRRLRFEKKNSSTQCVLEKTGDRHKPTTEKSSIRIDVRITSLQSIHFERVVFARFK